jgi:hypothetical protein
VRHVVDIQLDRLGNPYTGAVEQLEQGGVSQWQGAVLAGSRQQRLHLSEAERLRQPSGRPWRMHLTSRIADSQAVGLGEPM